MSDNYFLDLYSRDVSEYIEKKNGLSYLPWAYSWAEVKKQHPTASYKIYENNDGWNYFTDGRTCWVKTGVTINDLEHIEYLPVMDFKNKSIPLNAVTSFDVNKAIQRSLTKACARHGLGLFVYAGEDLPEEDDGYRVGKKTEPTIEQAKTVRYATPQQIRFLENIYQGENMQKLLDTNKITRLEELTAEKASQLISKIKNK